MNGSSTQHGNSISNFVYCVPLIGDALKSRKTLNVRDDRGSEVKNLVFISGRYRESHKQGLNPWVPAEASGGERYLYLPPIYARIAQLGRATDF